MSNSSNYINIADLPVIPEIAPGDYFTIKTPTGQYLIDFTSLPFVPISGNNVTINDTLTTNNLVISDGISANKVYLTSVFIDGVSGVNAVGSFNTFKIQSGIVTDARNTNSTYVDSVSSTTDTKINAVSAAVPRIFTDGGVVLIDGADTAPSFSEVIIGNNDVPQNLFIEAADINVKYLFNSSLDSFLTNSYDLSGLPQLLVEENVSNSYVNSNNKIQFRVIFRPGLRRNVRVTWNIIKIY